MMNRLFYACAFLFAGVYSSAVMADSCPTVTGPNPIVLSPPSPQTYTGPQDAISHGAPIGNGFSAETDTGALFTSCSSGQMQQSNAAPIKAPISGIKYNDGSYDYDVYDSGVAGIGYSIGIKDISTPYKPLQYPSIQTYLASSPGTTHIGFQIKIVFVVTGHLNSGAYNIPAQTVGTLSATQFDGQTNTDNLNITGVTVNITSTGCNVISANNATINLGDILPSAFTGVGSLAGSGSTTLSLQCDAGVQLWASMADSSNPANTTQTLSLTPDSVAQGVGIQFFANGSATPVTLGPDSSSKGLPYGFFIDNSTGDGSIIEFPIVAKYIQTGRLAPGSANGIATVTFSYQ